MFPLNILSSLKVLESLELTALPLPSPSALQTKPKTKRAVAAAGWCAVEVS